VCWSLADSPILDVNIQMGAVPGNFVVCWARLLERLIAFGVSVIVDAIRKIGNVKATESDCFGVFNCACNQRVRNDVEVTNS
jgi:hypothetical protein